MLQDSYLTDTFNECNYSDHSIQFDSFEEFIDEASSQQIETFMKYHPCRNSILKTHSLIYANDYERLDWAGRVLLETEKILRNTRTRESRNPEVGKVGKSNYQHLYIVSIVPKPTTTNVIGELGKLVKSVGKVGKYLWGVFELGDKNEGYHTHYIVQYHNKNNKQDFYKKIVKLNGTNHWLRLTIDPCRDKIHLIKTIRYLNAIGKNNKGYFEKEESYRQYISLTDYEDEINPLFEKKEI